MNERSHRERVVKAACILDRQAPGRLDCLIRNIGSGGAKLQFPVSLTIPEKFLLQIYSDKIEVECERVWTCGLQIGVEFLGDFRPLTRRGRT